MILKVRAYAIYGSLVVAIVAALALGFAGIALLIGPGLAAARHPHDSPLWALVPIAGSFSWAWGSLWSRRARMPRSPLMATGVGLVAGGAATAAVSVLARAMVPAEVPPAAKKSPVAPVGL